MEWNTGKYLTVRSNDVSDEVTSVVWASLDRVGTIIVLNNLNRDKFSVRSNTHHCHVTSSLEW